MHKNLLNQDVLDPEDYAADVVEQFQTMSWHPIVYSETEKGVTMESSVKIPEEKGYVLMAQGFEAMDNGSVYLEMIPIYIGMGGVKDRLYRFGKECFDKSRSDEGHPVATRYMKDKDFANPNMLFFKNIPFSDLRIPEDFFDPVKESVDHIIGTRYSNSLTMMVMNAQVD